MMNYIFILAYPDIFICLALLLLLLGGYRWFKWRSFNYHSALTGWMIDQGLAFKSSLSKLVLFGLRLTSLLLLAFSLARPQLVDPRSRALVKGIDIILALDVSSSMNMFDDLTNPKARIEIAKQEALSFISERDSDLIGLVLFARYAVSQCPLITDKAILENLIKGMQVGMIDASGTMLGMGLLTAVNRLKHSDAKNKLIILLTDGQSSPGDANWRVAAEIAKKLDIKIYTMGIGSMSGGYLEHPLFGVIQDPNNIYNPDLLKEIASSTGGVFFQAQDQAEMRVAYEQINRLEKIDRQAPVIYIKKIELFSWCLMFALGLLALELVLSYVVWFGV